MITFMQFIIAIYGLYKAVEKQLNNMSMKEWVEKVDQAVKLSKEAKTDAEKLAAAAALVDTIKRLG